MTRDRFAGRVEEHQLGTEGVNIKHLNAWDRTRRVEHVRSSQSGFNEVAIDSIIDPDMDTELLADAEERANKLEEALAALPDGYREVLELYYYQEKSAKEIAEELGLSVNAVTTRLSRARKLLGEIW